MKLYLLIYDVDFDEEIMETLAKCCVTGFTKWDRVLGKGARSEPKMDDAVWPGFNCAVAIAMEEENEPTFKEALRETCSRLGEAGIKIYELPIQEVDLVEGKGLE